MPKNILSDAEIELTVYNSRKDYPDNLRLVRYYDEKQGREFMFLTNAMDLTAQQIADLYKNRWQIELFFKWLKQHQDQKVLGNYRERSQNTDSGCYYCLLLGDCPARYEVETLDEVLQIRGQKPVRIR